jgi:hypothetical protein
VLVFDDENEKVPPPPFAVKMNVPNVSLKPAIASTP